MRIFFNLIAFLLIGSVAFAAPSNFVNANPKASTASALAAAGTQCSAGQAPRGVDASGNAQNCTVYASTGSNTFTGTQNFGGAVLLVQKTTVSGLTACAAGTEGALVEVTDGNDATDCTIGTGSNKNLCFCDGTVYTAVKGAL